MKKILCLVLVLSFGMITSSFDDSLSKTKVNSPKKIDEFIGVMLETSSCLISIVLGIVIKKIKK
jgi:hypothetical protein